LVYLRFDDFFRRFGFKQTRMQVAKPFDLSFRFAHFRAHLPNFFWAFVSGADLTLYGFRILFEGFTRYAGRSSEAGT